MNVKHLMSVFALLFVLGACDDAELPMGTNQPSAIPSEAPDSSDPPCLQTLQCIVDNTTNNGLRKQTQEVMNDLFLLAEPDYTRVCRTRADELTPRVPECLRN